MAATAAATEANSRAGEDPTTRTYLRFVALIIIPRSGGTNILSYPYDTTSSILSYGSNVRYVRGGLRILRFEDRHLSRQG